MRTFSASRTIFAKDVVNRRAGYGSESSSIYSRVSTASAITWRRRFCFSRVSSCSTRIGADMGFRSSGWFGYRTSIWRIRKPTAGYPSRKSGDQIEGFGRSIKVGAAESGWRCLMLPVVDGGGFRVRVWDQSGRFRDLNPVDCDTCIQFSRY